MFKEVLSANGHMTWIDDCLEGKLPSDRVFDCSLCKGRHIENCIDQCREYGGGCEKKYLTEVHETDAI